MSFEYFFMTTSWRTSVLATPILLLTIAACGDDKPATDRPAAGDTAGISNSTPAGDFEIPEVSKDAILDLIGQAADGSIGASGYEVDGKTLTFDMSGKGTLSGSECQILSSVASAFELPDGAKIVLDAGGSKQECELG